MAERRGAGRKAAKVAQIIPEFEIAILTADLPQYGLCAGKEGVVVDVQGGGAAYLLEFFTPEGDTIDVVFAFADQVRPQTDAEKAADEAAAPRPNRYTAKRIPAGARVALLQPQPEHGLRVGQEGEVLADFHGGYYYAVSFYTSGGVYIERPGIPFYQLRHIAEAETVVETDEADEAAEVTAKSASAIQAAARAAK